MTETAIKLSNVSKFYKIYNSPKDRFREALSPFGRSYHREFYALKNINLEVKKGEILGVVGKNGSGKSTLLKLISGVLGASGGNIQVNGKVTALLELGAGFNPQFTGLENIRFYGMILGLSEEVIESRLDAILAFADIGDFINQPLKTYSSGMKSRLGFAVAINVDPDILILDEVLAVGDVFFKRKCFNAIKEYFERGKTIVFVSHSNNSIVDLCSSALLLSEGKILSIDKPKEIITRYEKLLISGDLVSPKTETKPVEALEIEDDNSLIQKTDIEIFDLAILDGAGEKTNLLRKGEDYKFTYKVKNATATIANTPSFGIAFKNIKGTLVGGSRDHVDFSISPGQIVQVTRGIKIQFNGGSKFFTKLDFMADIGEGQEVLCVAPDVLYFEVVDHAKDERHQPIGLIDIKPKVHIEVM